MMNELVLEDLLAQVADDIPVPARGTQRVLDKIDASTPYRPSTSRFPQVLAVAAVIVVVGGLGVLIANGGSRTESKASGVPTVAPAAGATSSLRHRSATTPTTAAFGGSGGGTARALDGAKIVKTGTLDLQVRHGALRVTVNRVSGTAVGLGGYVANSKTNYGGIDPTAEVTIRVPVDAFETATGRLREMPGVKVLSDSENGSDVTAQYADLQAQLGAATTE